MSTKKRAGKCIIITATIAVCIIIPLLNLIATQRNIVTESDKTALNTQEHEVAQRRRRKLVVSTTSSFQHQIPKVIYQTWYKKDLPTCIQSQISRMMSLNKEWKWKFYDDDNIQTWMRQHFSGHVCEMYNSIQVGAAKADLWRYMVLYKHGGVYLDVDSTINTNLDEFIDHGDEAVLTREGNEGSFVQWLLIFKKGHPILKILIENILEDLRNNGLEDIIKTTGPVAFSNAAATFLDFEDRFQMYYEPDQRVKGVRIYGKDLNRLATFKMACASNTLYNDRSHWRSTNVVKWKPHPHVLWSRGWTNVIPCNSVPESYYEAHTQHRHTKEQLRSYFQGCSGLIWIRLNTGSQCDTETFIQHVLPFMTHPFTLVTTDGDNSVPSSIPSSQILLEHPLLVKWYGQNYDGTSTNSKLRPFPIGFDLHTMRQGSRGKFNGFDTMQAMHETAHVRENKIIFDSMRLSSLRRSVRSRLKCASLVQLPRLPSNQLWKKYIEFTFGISPHGVGIDCHRTWEMLYFGMIPIVKTSSLDPLYKDLPVLILQEWDDLCNLDLEKVYEEMKRKMPVSEDNFTLEKWLERF